MNWAKEQARIETEKYEQEKENHCLPVIFHPNRKNPLQRSYGVPIYISPEAPSALKCCCSLLPFPYPCPQWRDGDTWQPLSYPFTPPPSLPQGLTGLSVPYHISDAP